MKIALITHDFYPFIGGQGRHIYEIIKKIEDKPNINLVVFSPTDNDYKKHIQIFSITNRIGKNISLSFLLNFSIKNLIKKHSIDKIHIHCGPGGLFLLRKLDIPVIATCHHTYWQQYNYVKGQRWKKFLCYFEKKTYQNSDKIICVSEDSGRILSEKYNLNSDKIVVIPNGVDTDNFYPIEKMEKINNSLLYVGRLDERKGVDFLIKSMLLVVEQNSNIKLFVGGKGNLLTELKNYVEKNGLIENIEFIGFIPDNKLNEWYNKVKCVVVPSVFEGFGLTVIEAMAAGTPVIGTDVDGIKSIIKSGENGYLVKYGNTDALAKVILTVMENDNSKIIENGLICIKSKYDWEMISDEIGELYEEL